MDPRRRQRGLHLPGCVRRRSRSVLGLRDLKAPLISVAGFRRQHCEENTVDDVLHGHFSRQSETGRRALARDPGYVLQVVKRGTARAREITDATLRDDSRRAWVYSP